MLQEKVWVFSEIEEKNVDRIVDSVGISPILARVLLSRGMSNAEQIRKFLRPSLEDLPDPFLLKDMDKAVRRIVQAIRVKEKITIYGDYDVDGVTSTSILHNFLQRLGADVGFYIPDRMDEGYGLSKGALEKIIKTQTSLIITVDCGITAIEEVRYVNANDVDIIITDHHEVRDTLPEAYALINPWRPDNRYPFRELAGVGVAFKLISALCKELNLGNIQFDYLDLVTVGTIADVVPLKDENRIIVKNGIPKIENSMNLGLRTLVEACGLNGKPVTSWVISFVIAPRINAAGRIGSAGRAVKLFTTADPREALEIVHELNEENKFRQDTEQKILQEALSIIEKEICLEKEKVIVVSGYGWHHGVIGIVASRITEKYYRPCILVSIEEGMGKGSGRSIESLNLFKALLHCEHLLEKYGGHELAAGLMLKEENIPEFRKAINLYADTVISDNDLIPRIRIDARIGMEDVDMHNVRELEKLAPFGIGNPGPVFAYEKLEISEMKNVGDNKHLKLKLKDDGFYVDAIAFNMGNLSEKLNSIDVIDVACTVEINSWNSVDRVQLNIKDIKVDRSVYLKNRFFYNLDKTIDFSNSNDDNNNSDGLPELVSALCRELDINDFNINEIILEKQDIAVIYQYMRANYGSRFLENNLFSMARKVAESYKICMNYFKLRKGIRILEEINILKAERSGEYGLLVTMARGTREKANLESSITFRRLQALKCDWIKRDG